MRTLFLIFVLSFCLTSYAQNLTKELAQTDWKTAEQALALPAGYEVLSCEIVINNKNMILKVVYCSPKCMPQNCVNADQKRFDLLWLRMLNTAKKGDNINLENILVKKGEREIKWMSKMFLVP